MSMPERSAKNRSSRTNLKTLCNNAMEYGAIKAAPISARKIVVDPRVRMKCAIPVCDGYGRCLMCPPNIMSMEEFAAALEKYQDALVIQFEITMDKKKMEGKIGSMQLAKLRLDNDYDTMLTESMKTMSKALINLERDALHLGYRFTTALSAGKCRLCDECVGPGKGKQCRHPFEARPAAEALGVDVFATAANAGMPIEFPAKRPVWTCILLVD
jgi:predicted metal-binding protein